MVDSSVEGFQGSVQVEKVELPSLFEILVDANVSRTTPYEGVQRFRVETADARIFDRVTTPLPADILRIVRSDSGTEAVAGVSRNPVVEFDLPETASIIDYMGERSAQPVVDIIDALTRRAQSNSVAAMSVEEPAADDRSEGLVPAT